MGDGSYLSGGIAYESGESTEEKNIGNLLIAYLEHLLNGPSFESTRRDA